MANGCGGIGDVDAIRDDAARRHVAADGARRRLGDPDVGDLRDGGGFGDDVVGLIGIGVGRPHFGPVRTPATTAGTSLR